jgi:hypothetical protein
MEGAEQGFEEDFWAELVIRGNLKIILKSIDVDFAYGGPLLGWRHIKNFENQNRFHPTSH